MTANAIVQLVFYVVVLLLLAKPLGAHMARVYENRPCGLDKALGWLERLIYKVSGVRSGEEMGWKTYAATMLLFNLAGLLRGCIPATHSACRTCCRSTPGVRRDSPDSPVQHRGELHDEHELAGLRRRDDDELPEPDGGARLAQLPVGGGRHRRRDRARARPHPPRRGGDGRELGEDLTRTTRNDRCNCWTDSSRRCSSSPRRRAAEAYVFGRRRAADAGRRARHLRTPPVPRRRSRPSRAAKQVIAMGPGGLAGGDQAARDQRRRLLQRQRRRTRSRTRTRSPTSSRCS